MAAGCFVCYFSLLCVFTLARTLSSPSPSAVTSIANEYNVHCFDNDLSLGLNNNTDGTDWRDECFEFLTFFSNIRGEYKCSRHPIGQELALPHDFHYPNEPRQPFCKASLDMDTGFDTEILDFSELYEFAWSIMKQCILRWAQQPSSGGGYIDGIGNDRKLRFKFGRIPLPHYTSKQESITFL